MNCPFFIIWDNSGGSFLPATKRLSFALYIIVLKPLPNNLIYINVFRKDKAKIGPLMNNMVLSKDVVPLYLRWTIITFFLSRNKSKEASK